MIYSDAFARLTLRWIRHPAYLGFAMFALGTQMFLLNPICTVAYILALESFFRGRVHMEERLLARFFGQDYSMYKQRVPSGLPFIRCE